MGENKGKDNLTTEAISSNLESNLNRLSGSIVNLTRKVDQLLGCEAEEKEEKGKVDEAIDPGSFLIAMDIHACRFERLNNKLARLVDRMSGF